MSLPGPAHDHPQAVPQELPAELSYKLQNTALLAVKLLEDLTDTEFVGHDVVRLPAMPKSALLHAQGLVCLYRKKAGLLVSHTSQSGFIVGRVEHPDGTFSWSAPVFIRGRGLGLGLTAGVSRTLFCTALMNEPALERALRRKERTSLACSFLVDMNGSYLRKAQFDSSSVGPVEKVAHKGGAMAAKYFKGSAALVDCSANVAWSAPNAKLNSSLYGPDVKLLDVLRGAVPTPADFLPVHAMLDRLSAEAAAAMGRVRKDRSTRPGSGSRMPLSPSRSGALRPTSRSSSTQETGIQVLGSFKGASLANAAAGAAGGSAASRSSAGEPEPAREGSGGVRGAG